MFLEKDGGTKSGGIRRWGNSGRLRDSRIWGNSGGDGRKWKWFSEKMVLGEENSPGWGKPENGGCRRGRGFYTKEVIRSIRGFEAIPLPPELALLRLYSYGDLCMSTLRDFPKKS